MLSNCNTYRAQRVLFHFENALDVYSDSRRSGQTSSSSTATLKSALTVIETGIDIFERSAQGNAAVKLRPQLEALSKRLLAAACSGTGSTAHHDEEFLCRREIHIPTAPVNDETKRDARRAKERSSLVEERQQIAKWFLEIDVDGSGSIDVEEFSNAMVLKGTMTKAQATKLFNTIDENDDGGLDSGEVRRAAWLIVGGALRPGRSS